MNQILNLSDPLAKQKDASSKNGVVGSIGKNAPIVPKVKARNPIII